ncbi:MAG: endolytic transglycosylase MltG [Minisyncoccia bacterium]
MDTPQETVINKKPRRKLTFLVFCIIIIVFIWQYFVPPTNFTGPVVITVSPREPLSTISKHLEENHVIKSARLFEIFVISSGGEKRITTGDYFFDKPLTLLNVVSQFINNDFGADRIRITIPEGFTRADIAKLCEQKLPHCSSTRFMEKTKDLEGYLFPDTYLIFPTRGEDELIKKMQSNFSKKTESLFTNLTKSKIDQVVTLASIVEREAVGATDSSVIAGILYNRLNKNMPLQVDAPFYFLLGKSSSELTIKDLKTNSPYNTYINTGLPPTPISNPGLSSINAVLKTEKTDYIYYLHDLNGVAHYAKTYAEHLKNKKKYIQ